VHNLRDPWKSTNLFFRTESLGLKTRACATIGKSRESSNCLLFGPRKALYEMRFIESTRTCFPCVRIITFSAAGSFADSILVGTEMLCAAYIE